MSVIGDDRGSEATPLKEILSNPRIQVKKGEWRNALAIQAERIMNEPDFTPEQIASGYKHPLPKNPVWKAAYMFLKGCETGDIQYIRELANRLDGLPAQPITVDDKRSLEELSDAELNAAGEALRAILVAKNSSAGASASSEVKPAG